MTTFQKVALKSAPLALDLIKQNQKLSGRLADSIGRDNGFLFTQPKLYQPPENPIHETNRQLTRLGQEFSETALLIKNINDLGLKLIIDRARSSRAGTIFNTIMIFIALFTLIVTARLSYLSYTSSNESAEKIEQLLTQSNSSQNETLKHQKVNDAAVNQQLQNQAGAIDQISNSQQRQNAVSRGLQDSQLKTLEKLKDIEKELDAFRKKAEKNSNTPTP